MMSINDWEGPFWLVMLFSTGILGFIIGATGNVLGQPWWVSFFEGVSGLGLLGLTFFLWKTERRLTEATEDLADSSEALSNLTKKEFELKRPTLKFVFPPDLFQVDEEWSDPPNPDDLFSDTDTGADIDIPIHIPGKYRVEAKVQTWGVIRNAGNHETVIRRVEVLDPKTDETLAKDKVPTLTPPESDDKLIPPRVRPGKPHDLGFEFRVFDGLQPSGPPWPEEIKVRVVVSEGEGCSSIVDTPEELLESKGMGTGL